MTKNTVNPLNLVSKTGNEFAPEIYWRPFNLVIILRGFQVYIHLKEYSRTLESTLLHMLAPFNLVNM